MGESLFRRLVLLFITAFIASGYGLCRQSELEENKALVAKYEKEGNKAELAKSLNKLGNLYWQAENLKEASQYFEQSVSVNTELGNKNALRVLYNYLGVIYEELENYQKSADYYEKSLKLNLASKNQLEAASDYLNLSRSLQSANNYNGSNENAKKGLEIALGLDKLNIAKSCYGVIAENYEKLGKNKESAEYYEKYTAISKLLQKQQMDAMANKNKAIEQQVQTIEQQVQSKDKQLKNTLDTLGEMRQVNREMSLENQLLSKENELKELAVKEEEARRQASERVRRTQLVAFSAITLLFVLIGVLIYYQFSQKKKANLKLQLQNVEIERQKTEIVDQHALTQKQNKKITDSIQYARRIQRAMLPPEDSFKKDFKDYFILYRPKDIVSGDFYWVTKKDEILIIAAADCTGHGVPGAFMSMLGVAYLNEIVNKIAINKHISSLNADEILNQLREMVISSLHQTGNATEPKDGMDIALCIIDFEHKKMQYAGANNPLYLLRKGELIEYNAEKMPVSFHQKRDVPFSRHEIDLQPDDRIYLFTDGFVDQFGGNEGMKFLSKNFREILLKIHDRPMADQRDMLEKALDDWRGERPQLDDVLVIGIRFALTISKEKALEEIDWARRTILIAEDTDVNYFLLTEVLRHTKANLVRVKDGVEAVEFIKNNEVDLILMDINMPRMNGYDATRTIKKLRSHIPIIVQTAMHFDDEKEEAFNSGADDYIAKPIDLKTFMGKIERFLS